MPLKILRSASLGKRPKSTKGWFVIKHLPPKKRQQKIVERIIAQVGQNETLSYLCKFWPDADLNAMDRKQAKKIITGLQPEAHSF